MVLAAYIAGVTIGMPLYRLVTLPIILKGAKWIATKKMAEEFTQPFTVLGATRDARDGEATVYLSEDLFRKRHTISTAGFARVYGEAEAVSRNLLGRV